MSAPFMALRRPLSPRAAYALPAVIIGLSLYASSAPSPLYGMYSALWGFSPAILTLVYATYAVGVLITLLLAGRLSDEIGRRPVMLAAVVGIMGSTVVYALADSVLWLFVARALQGLATGLALSAAGAALFDLHPRRDHVSVGLANGFASASGAGLGIVVSAALVQLAPAPRVLPYVVLFVLLLASALAALRLKDPIVPAPGARLRLTPQRPVIHAAARRPFLLASLAVVASWSILGLFLALGPDLAADILHTHTLLVNGFVIFLLPAAASVSQLVLGRRAPWAGASIGSLGLALGMALLVVSVAYTVSALFVIACLLAGVGFGATFLSGLRALSAAVPHEHRAGVMSAFYIVAYMALSVPAIIAGFLVAPLGLTLTFEIFGSVIAATALGVGLEAWRGRPGRTALAAAPSREGAGTESA
ncbi:MFS transporter [Streptomyces sp. NPDC026672]|uniref:MFS transporter n=1 Tax=unclassified Streptomyces TaxID=2593676 RepID=UPI003409BFF6